jgi:hypothetical protein
MMDDPARFAGVAYHLALLHQEAEAARLARSARARRDARPERPSRLRAAAAMMLSGARRIVAAGSDRTATADR